MLALPPSRCPGWPLRLLGQTSRDVLVDGDQEIEIGFVVCHLALHRKPDGNDRGTQVRWQGVEWIAHQVGDRYPKPAVIGDRLHARDGSGFACRPEGAG